ncbi:membrane progestin receptor delta-like, partial [Discoglossus pictus]
ISVYESQGASHNRTSLPSPGCAFTYGAYVIPDRWVGGTLHRYYVPVAAFNTFICTGLSCYSRFLELDRPRLSKILRTVAFVHPFVFDNIPLLYRLVFCFGDSCTWNDAIPLHLYHLLFALLTGFLFASHLPERLAPGRFDYFGHSHQLFHICAVLGTHFQLEAVLSDRSSRRAWFMAHSEADSLASTLGVVATAVAGNIFLICFFTATLIWSPRANSILQSHVPGDLKKEH